MKRKILYIALVLCLTLTLLPACGAPLDGSIKSITRPYIDEYECIEARLGNEDILESYEYIRITLLDKKELEISYKPKDGEKRSIKGAYEIDGETRELKGEIGILGYRFKESVKIEKGQFTVTENIFGKTLFMKFESK